MRKQAQSRAEHAMGAALAVMSAVAVWAIARARCRSKRAVPDDGERGHRDGAREPARRSPRSHRQVRQQPGAGEGERLRDHHQDDPDDGVPRHEPQREGLRHPQAADPRVRAFRDPPGRSGRSRGYFTAKPAKPPLPGATYGAFGAGCHYKDGTFYPATAQSKCPAKAPGTGAAFNFWHPNLVTMHVWLWYPNPTGLFASTNPLVTPFNAG